MSLYSTLIRPLLFELNAETTHHATIEACRIAGALPFVPQITRACMGFKAPVSSHASTKVFADCLPWMDSKM